MTVCDPAGMGLDKSLFQVDPSELAKNVQCIYTSVYVGPVNMYECHQNWLMGKSWFLIFLEEILIIFSLLKATAANPNPAARTFPLFWASFSKLWVEITDITLSTHISSVTNSTRVHSITISLQTTNKNAPWIYQRTCQKTLKWATWKPGEGELLES